MSWYNNIMSILILIVVALLETDIAKFSQSLVYCSGQLSCWGTLLLSCFGGFCVSVTGFKAQEVLSPTSWLALNNISKIPAIVISCFLWPTNLTYLEVSGLCISMFGGYLYSLSRLLSFSRPAKYISVLICILLFLNFDTFHLHQKKN